VVFVERLWNSAAQFMGEFSMIFGVIKVFDGFCGSHWSSTAAGCELWLERHPAARLTGGRALGTACLWWRKS
jgi:hypothetical protein